MYVLYAAITTTSGKTSQSQRPIEYSSQVRTMLLCESEELNWTTVYCKCSLSKLGFFFFFFGNFKPQLGGK